MGSSDVVRPRQHGNVLQPGPGIGGHGRRVLGREGQDDQSAGAHDFAFLSDFLHEAVRWVKDRSL